MACFPYVLYSPAFQQAQVEETIIPLTTQHAALNGRKLLFISDIHVSRWFPRPALMRLIHQISELSPDMLLLGGDYAETAAWQEVFFHALADFNFPLGAYAVLGNNDLNGFKRDLSPLLAMMCRARVTPLIDHNIRLSPLPLSIAGLDEWKRAQPLRHPLFSSKDEAHLRILLSHYPHSALHYLQSAKGFMPHLCLTGHTHGGQLRLGSITPYSIRFEHSLGKIPLPTIDGWVDTMGSRLLVSTGVGTSRVPFRIGVPPKIHLLHLILPKSSSGL